LSCIVSISTHKNAFSEIEPDVIIITFASTAERVLEKPNPA
jgi:hypothetical protein